MSNSLTEEVKAVAKVYHYPEDSIILKEGEVCRRVSFIAKGLTRSFYIIDGADITSRLMDEGSFVTSWISYFTQFPGNEFIEAAEDSILVSVSHTDVQRILCEYPEFNINVRKQVEYSFYLSEQRTQLLRKHTAEEKYQFFLDHHPTLLQRVALKHIATYLGMSQETLSRVRSKYHRNH